MDNSHTTPDPDALVEALEAEENSRAVAAPVAGLWRGTLQWVVGLAAVALLAYFTYARAGWVPFLSGVDLGIHEFGHMIFMWTPPIIVWLAGSVVQVLAPAGLAAYFAIRRDTFAAILMTAWTAQSLNNVSVYIYDATRLKLNLWGDDGSKAGHDWANILTRLKLIPATDQIAYTVRGLSVVAFALAAALAIRGLARPYLEARRAAQLEARMRTLPVREPRNRPPA
ncbi:MAG: hypothetical protein Q8K99_00805 [Actinomycetota bacterium]|nr:hypothetical protein [Actinomycetota bacterium]